MSDVPHTAAELFAVVWHELTEVIGTAATATLLRRCIRVAVRQGAIDDGITVAREGFEYRYILPDAWNVHEGPPVETVRRVFEELRPLLVELAGPVLVRRLATSPVPEVARVFGAEQQR